MRNAGSAQNPDMVATVMRHTPLDRPGKPEDIAGPAAFLASDMSAIRSAACPLFRR